MDPFEQITTVTTAQYENAAKLLEKVCTSEDDVFLAGLLNAIIEKKAAAYTARHGFKVSNPTDWRAVKALGTPGPHFSLRAAGGAYRFGNNSFGLSELFVNSSKATIHVDGEPVRNLKVELGDVSFVTKDLKCFKIQFQCAQLPGDERSDPLFKGDTWSYGSEASKTHITGTKFYPWGNSSDKPEKDRTGRLMENIPPTGQGISEAKIRAAATVRVDAAMSSICVCLDMIRGHCDPHHDGTVVMAVSNELRQFAVPLEVYLGGFGLLLCTLAAGTGGYLIEKDGEHKWSRAGGMMFAASASYVVASAMALARALCVQRPSSEMRSFIKQFGAKEGPEEADQLLTWDLVEVVVGDKVDKLSENDLKDEPKVHYDAIKKSVSTAYKKEVRGKVGLATFRKFGCLRHLSQEEYRKILDEETGAKFTADVSSGLMEKLIDRMIKRRQAEQEVKTLADKIVQLNSEKVLKAEAREKAIEDMKKATKAEKHEAKEQEIKQRYQEELDKIEEDMKTAEKKREQAEKDKNAHDVEGAIKDIEDEIRETRQSEMEGQAKSHKPGK